jgi:hypothetical protein
MMKNALPRWLRRYSLPLVAGLGGAIGFGYAAASHGTSAPPTAPAVLATALPAPAGSQKPAEPPRDNVQDTVQIAILLDTSNSMDGLINQARSQLWTMVDQIGHVTRVVDGKTRGVKIELALYQYGNDTLSANSGYIQQVLPFTTDLDNVSEKLHALFTNGGSEYVGEVIETAVSQLAWSKDAAMRFIYVAGNETFDQGPVNATRAMAAAARRDITVQLIYCGAKEPSWDAAAKLARSDLMTIDQNQVAQYIPAPQDAEILRLGQELNGTYVAYGEAGSASVARQAKADTVSAKLSPKVALERAQLKAKKSYDNRQWDVVDASKNDGKFLEQTPDDQLPAELRGKSLDEKKQLIAGKTAAREQLQQQLAKLEADRNAFLEAERAKHKTAEESSLGSELMKSARHVAAKKGYKL